MPLSEEQAWRNNSRRALRAEVNVSNLDVCAPNNIIYYGRKENLATLRHLMGGTIDSCDRDGVLQLMSFSE
jgi:hypothetical protein